MLCSDIQELKNKERELRVKENELRQKEQVDFLLSSSDL
jgi:hypothetical protein